MLHVYTLAKPQYHCTCTIGDKCTAPTEINCCKYTGNEVTIMFAFITARWSHTFVHSKAVRRMLCLPQVMKTGKRKIF